MPDVTSLHVITVITLFSKTSLLRHGFEMVPL